MEAKRERRYCNTEGYGKNMTKMQESVTKEFETEETVIIPRPV